MIVSVDEFLTAGYARDQIDRKPLTDEEIASMTRLVATSDMKAKLATLQGKWPDQRCHISRVNRDLLIRALAARTSGA